MKKYFFGNFEPCPHCGSEDLRPAWRVPNTVECYSCSSTAPAETWNRRAAPPIPRETNMPAFLRRQAD